MLDRKSLVEEDLLGIITYLLPDPVLTFSLFSLFSFWSTLDDLVLRFATRRAVEPTQGRTTGRPSGDSFFSVSFSGDKALKVKDGAGEGGTFEFM
jgi:hypothetical protein